ncbi:hypothetical protein HMPREF1228_0047 [Streptococcus pyogenes GA41345]|nr:hypothetical protein HMPREF1228_0047 [Streptococcus pyogenes GA41345]
MSTGSLIFIVKKNPSMMSKLVFSGKIEKKNLGTLEDFLKKASIFVIQ